MTGNIVNLPRGIRNNNPGNIRKTVTHWRGETISEFERSFETFEKPEFGIRATMILLLNYYLKYQLFTPQSIINRWAPPHENDTGAYAAAVARKLGVGVTDRINLFDKVTLIKLSAAIFVHENGQPPRTWPDSWYAPSMFEAAADMAYASVRGGK